MSREFKAVLASFIITVLLIYVAVYFIKPKKENIDTHHLVVTDNLPISTVTHLQQCKHIELSFSYPSNGYGYNRQIYTYWGDLNNCSLSIVYNERSD